MQKSRDYARLSSDVGVDIFHIGSAYNPIPVLSEPFVGFLQSLCQRLYNRHQCYLLTDIQIVVIIMEAEIGTLGMGYYAHSDQICVHSVITELDPIRNGHSIGVTHIVDMLRRVLSSRISIKRHRSSTWKNCIFMLPSPGI